MIIYINCDDDTCDLKDGFEFSTTRNVVINMADRCLLLISLSLISHYY